MFRRRRVLKARPDPDFPDAPCLLVWGSIGDLVEGETIDVRMPDRTIIPGFVRAWIESQDEGPSRGTWVVQIAPLSEGDDALCNCLPIEINGQKALTISPYCPYHMLREEEQ